jgi:hypothetical protein
MATLVAALSSLLVVVGDVQIETAIVQTSP